jgi:hypothetical protein
MATKAASKNGVVPVNRISEVLDTPGGMRPEVVMFRITGISPLLQNNPASFIGVTEDAALGGKKVYVDAEEAAARVYRDAQGRFGHPAEGFIRSMIRAVTGRKFGKKSAPAVIKGSVFLVEQFCALEDSKGKELTKYEIDRRSVIVGKARILRCRPVWMPWCVRLPLEIDTSIVAAVQVLQALQLAGRIIGAGDFRPEKGGGCGRYSAEII